MERGVRALVDQRPERRLLPLIEVPDDHDPVARTSHSMLPSW